LLFSVQLLLFYPFSLTAFSWSTWAKSKSAKPRGRGTLANTPCSQKFLIAKLGGAAPEHVEMIAEFAYDACRGLHGKKLLLAINRKMKTAGATQAFTNSKSVASFKGNMKRSKARTHGLLKVAREQKKATRIADATVCRDDICEIAGTLNPIEAAAIVIVCYCLRRWLMEQGLAAGDLDSESDVQLVGAPGCLTAEVFLRFLHSRMQVAIASQAPR
jgi:hypothetical protein